MSVLPPSCHLVARQAVLSSSMYATHISIPLGIIIGLLASFVQSLGLTIQRKSHVLNQLLPEHQQRAERRRPLWLLGFAIFISSNILGSLVQIASLPVVILAPLGAVSLLWNAFFARLILGDVFSPWMILGTFLIAGGAILIAIFGIVPELTRSLEDLLELFRRPTFIVYFSILGFVVVVCLAITHVADYSYSRKLLQVISATASPPSTPSSSTLDLPAKPSALTTDVAGELADAVITTERTPLLDRKPKRCSPSPSPSFRKPSHDPSIRSMNRTRLLLAVSYASFSGIISGMCLLFAKSGVELLLLTLRGRNQFWRWQAWVLVLGLIVFALLQLWYLHKALILADPTLVCPSAFCFYNLSSIVNGLIYFDQFSLIPPLHLGLVILGMFVLLGGVWVVSIQSGSGEADTESWSESDDPNEDASSAECDIRDIEDQPGSGVRDDVPEVDVARRDCIGPLPMERETRSESNIHMLSISPETVDIDIELGHSMRPPSTASQPAPPLRSLLSPERHFVNSEADPQITPFGPRSSHRRRPMPDAFHEPSSSQHGHARTSSYSHTHSSYIPLSPPLNPVSTLGAGFQIGLSPVSPGFAIVPRERGRRSSGLGLGIGPGFSDAVIEVTFSQRERQRRRTVSEGDVRRRALALARSRRSVPEVGELEEQGNEGGNGGGENAGDPQDVTGRGKGKTKEGRVRWKWLRKVFTGRN